MSVDDSNTILLLIYMKVLGHWGLNHNNFPCLWLSWIHTDSSFDISHTRLPILSKHCGDVLMVIRRGWPPSGPVTPADTPLERMSLSYRTAGEAGVCVVGGDSQ